MFYIIIMKKGNETMKKTKNDLNLLIIFMLIAIIFMVCGIFLSAKNKKYVSNGIKTEATITRLEYDDESDEQKVYVKFHADGVTYEGKLDAYSSFMHEGDTIAIYYMPDNPNDFSCGKMNSLPPLLCFSAAIILFAASAVIMYGKLRKLSGKTLIKNGNKITATINYVEVNDKTKVLEKMPATLYCIDDNHNVYSVKFLMANDENYKNGDKIDVYTDKNNSEKYFIDREKYLSDNRNN